MKKAEQLAINEDVKNVYYTVKRFIGALGECNKQRLRTCQAFTAYTFGFTVLYSYETLVAAIDRDGNGYDFLRLVYGYTATSAQHISKFFNDYNVVKKFTYKPI